jgi:hypothetical protein
MENQTYAKSLSNMADERRNPVIEACWQSPAFRQLTQDLGYEAGLGRKTFTPTPAMWADIDTAVAAACAQSPLPIAISREDVLEHKGFETVYGGSSSAHISFKNPK